MIKAYNEWVNEKFSIDKNTNQVSYTPRNNDDFINDNLGKDKNFSFYVKTLKSLEGEKFTSYSTYSTKKNDYFEEGELNKREIMKLLKGQSDYLISDEDVLKFVKASAILSYSKLKNDNIDFFISMDSSSPLVHNFMKELEERFIGSTFIEKGIIKNPNLKDISIYPESNLPIDSIKKIESALRKIVRDNEGFKIRKINTPHRKFIQNWLKIDENKVDLNKIKNMKIVLVDDFISSGTTFIEAYNLLSKYTTDIKCLTLLKNS